MAEHPSPLSLESLAAGEEEASARAHLETCAECRAHVEALRRAIDETPEAPRFLDEVSAKAKTPVRTLPRRAALVAGALALAAGLALLVRPAEDTRLKGRPTLSVIRERDGAQQRFAKDCKVRPGDRLLLEFAVPERGMLTAGIRSEAGQWLELEPPSTFEPGAHVSRSSFRVDAEGLRGVALVGTTRDVELARRGEPSGATAIAIERDSAP